MTPIEESRRSNSVRRIVGLAATIAAILTLAFSGPVAAVRTPNQHQDLFPTGGAYWGSVYQLAQTFQPSATGNVDLASAHLQVHTNANVNVKPAVPPTLTVGIYATTSGLPSGPALATSGGAIPDTADWYDFTFSPVAPVVKDTTYALVVQPEANSFVNWSGVCTSDEYDRGQALVNNDGWETLPAFLAGNEGANPAACQLDFAFRIFLTGGTSAPPTATAPAPSGESGSPSSLLLFIGCAAAAAFVAARRMAPVRR
jgi:hypothetical protein